MISLKRAYEEPDVADGRRFLVDRLWPRGVKKEALAIEAWLKEVAPSDELRRWYHRDAAQWEVFQRRYRAELDEHPEHWEALLQAAGEGDVTLVYSGRDTARNNAVVLKAYLEEKLEESDSAGE